MFKYPFLVFFKIYFAVANGIRGVLFLMFARQGTQKNNIVNRFHQIGPQKRSTKSKEFGYGPFKHV